MPLIRRAGDRRHEVALQSVARSSSGEGYAETWTTYATVWAAVLPYAPGQTDRVVAATTETPISHLVELDYRSDLEASHRVLFDSRKLFVRSLQNVAERNVTHLLFCEERVQ